MTSTCPASSDVVAAVDRDARSRRRRARTGCAGDQAKAGPHQQRAAPRRPHRLPSSAPAAPSPSRQHCLPPRDAAYGSSPSDHGMTNARRDCALSAQQAVLVGSLRPQPPLRLGLAVGHRVGQLDLVEADAAGAAELVGDQRPGRAQPAGVAHRPQPPRDREAAPVAHRREGDADQRQPVEPGRERRPDRGRSGTRPPGPPPADPARSRSTSNGRISPVQSSRPKPASVTSTAIAVPSARRAQDAAVGAEVDAALDLFAAAPAPGALVLARRRPAWCRARSRSTDSPWPPADAAAGRARPCSRGGPAPTSAPAG